MTTDNGTYRVVFKGRILENHEIDQVKANLATALKLEASKVDRLFTGGRIIIKKNAALTDCENTVAIFQSAGAVCEIEKEKSTGSAELHDGPPPLPPMNKETAQVEIPGPARQGDEKFCVSCGRAIKLNTLVCPFCGKKNEQNKMGCLPKVAIAVGIGMLLIPVMGIIAAIAIPNFISYRHKAYESAIRTELNELRVKQEEYYGDYGSYSMDPEALDYRSSNAQVIVTIQTADQDCYEASAIHIKYHKKIWVDCKGFNRMEEKNSQ